LRLKATTSNARGCDIHQVFSYLGFHIPHTQHGNVADVLHPRVLSTLTMYACSLQLLGPLGFDYTAIELPASPSCDPPVMLKTTYIQTRPRETLLLYMPPAVDISISIWRIAGRERRNKSPNGHMRPQAWSWGDRITLLPTTWAAPLRTSSPTRFPQRPVSRNQRKPPVDTIW
jgi:hypothetical protein